MKRIPTVSLVVLLLASTAFTAGCGGGGGTSPTPTPTPSATATPSTVVPRLVINWGERSRAIGGLSSALSVVIRLQGAKPDGSDLVFTVNRNASLTGYTTTVSTPEAVRIGS